jgi:hypothetical protein
MEDWFDDAGSELWTQQRAAHEQAEGNRPEEQVERKITVERDGEVSSGNTTVKEGKRLLAHGRLQGPEHFSKSAIALRLGSECGNQLCEQRRTESLDTLREKHSQVSLGVACVWEGDSQYQGAERIEDEGRLRGPPTIQCGSADARPFRHLS